MLSDETTIPEMPALIIPTGRDLPAPLWRAWIGERHLVTEQAAAPTRDEAIRGLLRARIARYLVLIGDLVMVWCEERELMHECLLVRIEAQAEGWTYKIVEVC